MYGTGNSSDINHHTPPSHQNLNEGDEPGSRRHGFFLPSLFIVTNVGLQIILIEPPPLYLFLQAITLHGIYESESSLFLHTSSNLISPLPHCPAEIYIKIYIYKKFYKLFSTWKPFLLLGYEGIIMNTFKKQNKTLIS